MVVEFYNKHVNARPEWAVATVASVTYSILFLLLVFGVITNDLWFGFCVWGDDLQYDPPMSCGDATPRLNSHMSCLYVGAVAVVLEFIIWITDDKRNEGKNPGWYFALFFILSGHGLLHWLLQQTTLDNVFGGRSLVINCYQQDVEEEWYFIPLIGVYTIWTYGLAILIQNLGVGTWKPWRSLLLTAPTVVFVYYNSQFTLTTLFVMTHLLCSWCGLASDDPPVVFASVWVANIFTVVNIIAIVELVACPEVLKPLGGHVWYDIGLAFVALSAGLAISGRDNFKFSPTDKGNKQS